MREYRIDLALKELFLKEKKHKGANHEQDLTSDQPCSLTLLWGSAGTFKFECSALKGGTQIPQPVPEKQQQALEKQCA